MCSALRLPFFSSKISVVTAFLYDPYNSSYLYKEVNRVLQDEGIFIGTLPHFEFCTILRRILGYDKNKTKFLTKGRYLVERDSFLMSNATIEDKMYDLCLPQGVHEVSEHIRIPASDLGLSVYSLPIVKLIIAKK
jgi:hypothetical protein